jgi:hypothetical protein
MTETPGITKNNCILIGSVFTDIWYLC